MGGAARVYYWFTFHRQETTAHFQSKYYEWSKQSTGGSGIRLDYMKLYLSLEWVPPGNSELLLMSQ